ncbi:phage portal protein [Pseudarthrobacter sp. ATCC 49987]|uniref:phage portal protein n=1 Tax=Pseudarthrobacter sp. ATCC 49987 TaxID=2698204 RepID=UPI00136BEEF8|nr:phage portal protein [Pseudarthrobacter sp. ATCC 49987]
MSIFFGNEERSLGSPVDNVMGGSFATGGGLGGRSMKGSLRVVPVYAATSLIADSLAVTPISAFQRKPNGARVTPAKQPGLVTNPNPNPLGTRIDWLHQCTTSLKLRGNAYGVAVDVDAFGTSKVQWLNPDGIHVDESGPLPDYYYNGKKLVRSEVVHIAEYVLPGSVVGLSPIEQFRAQIEMAQSAQTFGNNVYRRSGVPSGHLKNTKQTLSALESGVVKSRFKSSVANGDVFVSGNDWEYNKLGLSMADVQFLEQIKATANQVAAIYKVPPEEIGGDSGNSLKYTTEELNQQKFIRRALQPTAVRLEHHLNRLLLPGYYVKFNLNASARGDLKSRMEAYEVGLRIGVYTLEQVREFEDFEMLTQHEIDQWQIWFGNVKKLQNGGGSDA